MNTLAVAMSLAGLLACTGSVDQPGRPPSTVAFPRTNAHLFVEIADDVDEQRQGLMGVESLPPDQGMAFLYSEPIEGTFWMKDTLIPLSIAFVDVDGIVVGVLDMEPCGSDSCPNYGIEQPYVLAIEANLGWFQEHGVGVGDRAELKVKAYL